MNKDKAQRFRETNSRESRTVEWQKRQDAIRTRDNYICQHCHRSSDILLHIHHRYYVDDGRRYWEYPDKAFISLCEDCHQREEDALFDAQYEIRRAVGWRDGEASHLMRLAKALDKVPDHYTIADITNAVEHFIERQDIFAKVVEMRKPIKK